MERKLLRLIFILVYFVILPGAVYSSSPPNRFLEATVEVNRVFQISLPTQTTRIDFGKIDPGSTTERKKVEIMCETNDGSSWTVSVYVQNPLTSGEDIIPNSNFNWEAEKVVGKARGTVIPSGLMDTTHTVFYRAADIERLTDEPVELNLYLSIDIPRNQPAGQYRATMYVTMHAE